MQSNASASYKHPPQAWTDKPSTGGMLLLICGILGSTIIGRGFTALGSGSYDAQLFAYIGLKWLHGNIPYVDIWDNKPPGIFAVNALVFWLFPKSFTALAWMEGIFIVGCAGTVHLLMRQWGGSWRVASLAAIVVATTANLFYYNERGNLTEIYLLLPVTLSMYFFAKAAPRFQGKWVFVAGFFAGMAALFKPVGLSPLLAQAVFLLLLWGVFRNLSLRYYLSSVILNGTGALLAWLPFSLYFWMHDAFRDFMNAAFLYNVGYGLASASSQNSILSIILDAASRLYLLNGPVVCVIIGLVLYVRRSVASQHHSELEHEAGRAPHFWWPLVCLWGFFDLAGALVGGRNYPHYFLALVPSLSVAGGITYWFLVDRLPHDRRSWAVEKAIFALIVGPLILTQVLDVRQLRRDLVQAHRPATLQPWRVVATHLQAICSPNDTLFTWDYLPGIFFVTEMKSPTRHLDAHHIFDSAASYRKFGDEVLHALRQAPPTFIVADTSNHIYGADDLIYKQFRDFLEDDYVGIGTIEELKIYANLVQGQDIQERTISRLSGGSSSTPSPPACSDHPLPNDRL